MRYATGLLTCLLFSSAALAADVPTPQWIWKGEAKDNQSIAIRKVFKAPGDGQEGGALLQVVCDNSCRVHLNGKLVGQTTDWKQPLVQDVTEFIKPGAENVLVVQPKNSDGPGGFLARLAFKAPWSGPQVIVSDGTWKVANKPSKGWTSPDFDDSSWADATVLGPLGSEPWASITAAKLDAMSKLKKPEVTLPEEMKVAKGFAVELVYDVPQDEQGSWVSMCTKPDGTLVVSDQYGKLYHVEPGKTAGETVVTPIDVDLGHAQGLLWHFDSLYVMVNSRDLAPGLYRITDSDGDGALDKKESLLPIGASGGEHGPHAIVPSPDGESLYLICGNQCELPEGEHAITSSQVPTIWAEDQVTPRIYGRGFMRTKMAPGGYILKVNEDCTSRELVSVGYRNQYDAAFNWRGDLFTYDADMEWDWNTPWYRPTRVCHATAGSEWGWRNGSAKFLEYYPDNLPPAINIGPGSPTGVCAGTGAKFPAKYQDAIYIADWTYGKLYAIHLTEDGGSYAAEKEEFITGTPLPLTDVVVNPADGAMYFAIGGRRIKSGLYRVKYVGEEDTSPAVHIQSIPPLHELRQKLEAVIEDPQPEGLALAWANIGHEDRFVRFAARTALEQIAVAFKDEAEAPEINNGIETALSLTSPRGRIEAIIASVRVAETLSEASELDEATFRSRLIHVLNKLDWDSLDTMAQHAAVRAYGLILSRMGQPAEGEAQSIVDRFSERLTEGPLALQTDIFELLVALDWDEAAPAGIALLSRAATQEQQIAVAKSLRLVTAGWSDETLKAMLEWFNTARTYRGGMSFELYVNEIREEILKLLSDEQKLAFDDIINKPVEQDAIAAEPREFVKKWTVDEAMTVVEARLKDRDFDNGRKMYAAAKCAACHRFGVDGGAIGPDLTGLAGRFRPKDLLTSIIDPSKEISDQYAAKTFITLDGRVITGRIANLSGDQFRINTNMLDPAAMVAVDRKMIDEVIESTVSMMPTGLLDTLNEDEVLDLMAYLLSRGDRSDPMFGTQRAAR